MGKYRPKHCAKLWMVRIDYDREAWPYRHGREVPIEQLVFKGRMPYRSADRGAGIIPERRE